MHFISMHIIIYRMAPKAVNCSVKCTLSVVAEFIRRETFRVQGAIHTAAYYSTNLPSGLNLNISVNNRIF
jgi:hypothetical protein